MAQAMRSDDPDQQGCPACGHPLPEHARDDADAVRAALDPTNAVKLRSEEWDAQQRAEMIRTGYIPTLAHYRKVYDNLHTKHGYRLVSDEEILRTHLVAR